MKQGRFSAILDAYGAEPERWPERERADALALSRSSVVAARALAQARALDAALRNFGAIEPEPARLAFLQSRIIAQARPLAMNWFVRWFGIDVAPRLVWQSVAGLALATVLGFAVGASGVMQQDSPRDADDLVLTAIDVTTSVP